MRWLRLRWLVPALVVVVVAGVASAAIANSHRRNGIPDEEEHEDVHAVAASSTGSCGVERWSVKTGTDADSGSITLQSTTSATIAALDALTAPSTLPADNRVKP